MRAVLHVVSDRVRHRLPLLDALSESIRGGADVIQIREKKAPASETYELVRQLQTVVASQHGVCQVFVNDRVDVAIATQSDGVHLAAKSLPASVVSQLRRQAQWHGQVGCSVHSFDEAVAAEKAGADYVTFGHIYASESHIGVPPRGLHALKRIVDALTIPVIAIGGIDRTNVGPVLKTGCSGIAVIGAVLDTANPYEATMVLRAAMQAGAAVPKVPFGSFG